MDNRLYSKGQLLSMEACTGCAACAEACPAVNASGNGELSGLYRLDWRRKANQGWLRRLFGGKPPTDEQWKAYSDTVFRCTLCGNCAEVCPAGIGLKDLWLNLRQELVEQKACPAQGGDDQPTTWPRAATCFGEDQDDRAEWVEDLDEPPEDLFIKDRAEVVYFTGCVASYLPSGPADTHGPGRGASGGGRWTSPCWAIRNGAAASPCWGRATWPAAQGQLMEHNLEVIARPRGPSEVVFACPSCYMMWREHYPQAGLKLSHATQFLDRLLATGPPAPASERGHHGDLSRSLRPGPGRAGL